MSNSSLHLSLPYIEGGQAQKHVTHNEAIRTLDALVQLSVRAQVIAPDGTEVDGDRYIVAPGGTGDFSGQDGQIAQLETGIWGFVTPKAGWVALDQAAGSQVVYSGTDWSPIGTAGPSTTTDRLGINATADTTNRLTSAADATLLTHDTSGDHQLKINKSTASATSSLLFQTGFSGRAEMGTTGGDDFEVKVSADGSTFRTGLRVNSATGEVALPNTNLADPALGAGGLATTDFVISRASGAVTNATGHLGSTYNYPSTVSFDGSETPNLPGAFAKAGYYTGAEELTEALAIDPNRVQRLGVYLRQESVAGNWSGFENGARHAQYLGFRCYDADGLAINAAHHARYHHAGNDSLTTLTQPLTPGDTVVQVADASGWNESATSGDERGLVIFGYRNAAGKAFDFYSRIEGADLFDLDDVDKATGQITLNQPLPASLGNPDDSAGTWPAGTRIANRALGWDYKFGFFQDLVLPATDTWYRIENAIGGIDRSGLNIAGNFPPGTASVRPVWLLNYTNRSGGFAPYPDTGNSQRIWISGISVDAEPSGRVTRQGNGACELHVVSGDPATGALTFAPAALSVSEV